MAKAIRMPKIGMTDGDIQLLEYAKKEGDAVNEGDILFTMESDKVASEAESPAKGIVLKTYAEPGASVPIGGLIMVIGEAGEDITEFGKEEQPEKTETEKKEDATIVQAETKGSVSGAPDIKSSPVAARIAEQNGISLADVASELGLTRRIQKEDVEEYISRIQGDTVRIQVTGIRKAIAANMHGSLRSMAQTSVFVELDVSELSDLRKKLLEEDAGLGKKISMTDLFSLATIKMLKDHPLANAEWRETEIVAYPHVHLSIAVATDYGLVSPVIKNADKMGLAELSKAMGDMVARARERKLEPDEMAGGTFTITNMGVYPADGFNPIINPPQSAILGFGRIADKPAVYEGQIAIRKMMWLSLTYDHRVFDGSEAGGILKDMEQYLEHPKLFYR